MPRIATAVAMVVIVCAGLDLGARADERILSYHSYNSGKAFESAITTEALEPTPVWKDSNSNPPLSARNAMQLADQLKGKLVHDTDDGQWERVAMELRLATADHWYWLARYELVRDGSGPAPDLILLVLMDGTVVTPRIYPERKFISHLGDGPLNQGSYFYLSGTTLTDGGLAHLQGMRCLQSINLVSSEVTDHGLAHLKELIQLQALNVSSPKITDAGLEHLRALNQLEHLTLQSPRITDAGLRQLGRMTSLRGLWLEDCEVTGHGLEHLKGLNHLKDLALRGARVKGDGLEDLKGLSELQMLDLEDNPIDDSGMVHLSGLIQLQVLNLSSTGVTDAGLEHLAELKQLVTLHLRDTHVTDDGAKSLQEALPDCTICR